MLPARGGAAPLKGPPSVILFLRCRDAKEHARVPRPKKRSHFSWESTFQILISKPEQHSNISSRIAGSLRIPKNPLEMRHVQQGKIALDARGRLRQRNWPEKHAPASILKVEIPELHLLGRPPSKKSENEAAVNLGIGRAERAGHLRSCVAGRFFVSLARGIRELPRARAKNGTPAYVLHIFTRPLPRALGRNRRKRRKT